MTHIGYAKPWTFVVLRALETVTELPVKVIFLSSYRLSPTSRFNIQLHWPESPTPSKVSFLSAPSLFGVTNKLPHLPHSAHRFSQPLSRINARNNLWVYSTPQALQGLWPSKFNLKPIGTCYPAAMLLHRYCLYTVSFRLSFWCSKPTNTEHYLTLFLAFVGTWLH